MNQDTSFGRAIKVQFESKGDRKGNPFPDNKGFKGDGKGFKGEGKGYGKKGDFRADSRDRGAKGGYGNPPLQQRDAYDPEIHKPLEVAEKIKRFGGGHKAATAASATSPTKY